MKIIFTLTLLFFLFPEYSRAQSCEELIEQFQNTRDEIDLNVRKALADKMIAVCSETHEISSEKRLEALFLNGYYYESIGNLNKADSLYRATYDLVKQFLPEDHHMHSNLLNSLAVVSARLGDADSALFFYKKALSSIFKREGKSENYSEVLFNLGDIYVRKGEYTKAETIIDECKQLLDDLGIDSTYTYANTFLYKAHFLGIKGDHKAAIENNKIALSIFRNIYGTEHWYYGYALINLARSYSNSGLLHMSVDLWEEALNVYERTVGKTHPYYSNGVYNFAALLNELGEYQRSLELKLEAYEQLKKVTPDQPDLADILTGIGRTYIYLGQFHKALQYQKEGLEHSLRTRHENNPKNIPILSNIASTYLSLGQYDLAEKYYKEALEKVELVYSKDHTQYTERMSGMGYFFEHTGEFEKTYDYYKFAYEHGKSTYDSLNPEYVKHINNLAIILRKQKKYGEALPLMLETVEKTKAILGVEHPQYSIRLNSLGVLYRHLGEYQKAKTVFNQSLALGEQYLGKDHIDNAISLNNVGSLYDIIGQVDSAFIYYQAANEITKNHIRQNFSGLSENEKESFFKQLKQNFDQYKSFALNHKEVVPEAVEMIFNNEILQKGQLLNSTKSVLTSIKSRQDTALINKYEHWLLLRENIAFLYSQPQKVRQLINLDSLQSLSNDLERGLVISSSGFKKSNDVITLQAIKKNLAKGEAVIEFTHFRYSNPSVTDSVVYAALVYHAGLEYPRMVPLFEEKQLEVVLNQKSLSTINTIDNIYSSKLYNLIWQPIENLFEGIQTIYYCPSGLLHKISLPAIPAGNLLLTDKYDLEYLSSSRNLVYKEANKTYTSPSNSIVYGGINYEPDFNNIDTANVNSDQITAEEDFLATSIFRTQSERGKIFMPLDTTMVELNTLDRLFKLNKISCKALKGHEASEASFKAIGQQFSSPDILHVATHGFFFPDPDLKSLQEEELPQDGKSLFKYAEHPLYRSGLIMAGANYAWKEGKSLPGLEDGILTAYEISNLDLSDTKLVVLSACKTGLGEIKGSEGVYGLQRAFKLAGADYLIMTLWNIPDSHHTVEFMETFYSKWLSDKLSIPMAFNMTQDIMRKKYKKPYYWAAYQLIQ